ncbi:hypothetical protein D3C86_1853160 [compost metagenome]
MPSVRARCDCASRCLWNASVILAGGLGARLGLRSVRRAMAWSSWRAFWKSPRQSRATPSLASRNAVSAGVWSSAITTRFGGGRPASERHSALRSAPSSVQWMVGREEESDIFI